MVLNFLMTQLVRQVDRVCTQVVQFLYGTDFHNAELNNLETSLNRIEVFSKMILLLI